MTIKGKKIIPHVHFNRFREAIEEIIKQTKSRNRNELSWTSRDSALAEDPHWATQQPLANPTREHWCSPSLLGHCAQWMLSILHRLEKKNKMTDRKHVGVSEFVNFILGEKFQVSFNTETFFWLWLITNIIKLSLFICPV